MIQIKPYSPIAEIILMVNPKGIDFSDWGLYFEQINFLLERSKEKTYLFGLYFEQIIFFCSSLRFFFISNFLLFTGLDILMCCSPV